MSVAISRTSSRVFSSSKKLAHLAVFGGAAGRLCTMLDLCPAADYALEGGHENWPTAPSERNERTKRIGWVSLCSEM